MYNPTELFKQLKAMNKVNNTLKVDQFTIFYSTANLGQLPGLNEDRYYDIMGEDGIEGEYMTKEEVSEYLSL